MTWYLVHNETAMAVEKVRAPNPSDALLKSTLFHDVESWRDHDITVYSIEVDEEGEPRMWDLEELIDGDEE